jgi:hypothetical protein
MRAKTAMLPLSVSLAPNDRTSLMIVAAVTGAACAALVWALPAGEVLPALGILLIVCSAMTAFLAFAIGSKRGARGFTTWDAAGFFAFFGCCAAMLSEPDHVLALLEGHFAHQADPFPREPPL